MLLDDLKTALRFNRRRNAAEIRQRYIWRQAYVRAIGAMYGGLVRGMQQMDQEARRSKTIKT